MHSAPQHLLGAGFAGCREMKMKRPGPALEKLRWFHPCLWGTISVLSFACHAKHEYFQFPSTCGTDVVTSAQARLGQSQGTPVFPAQLLIMTFPSQGFPVWLGIMCAVAFMERLPRPCARHHAEPWEMENARIRPCLQGAFGQLGYLF